MKESLAGDVAAVPVYDGPGGTATRTTLTPENPGVFPGDAVTAATRNDLTGEPAVKTLTPGDGQGRAGSSRVRDDAGRVTSETDQNRGKTAFTYTPGGQVKESVSPAGVKTVFTYEEETGRVLEAAVTSADGKSTQRTAYTYDPETGRVTEVYHPDDRDNSLISYTHDADGNVLKVAYPDGKSIGQTFDDHGQLTSLTDAAGAKTVYTYSPDGTLKTAVQHDRDPAVDGEARELARVSYEYDGLGRITEVVRGDRGSKDHITTAYTYTGASQVRTEKTTGPGGTVITGAAYEYDAHGNLTRRTDTRPETTTGTPADSQDTDSKAAGPLVTTSTGYRYDAYNRLLGSEVKDEHGAVLSSAAYTLNVSGDVTRTEVTDHTQGGKKTVTGHETDPAGRLTAVTTDGKKTEQKWDGEGNLLTGHRGTAYTYDPLSRPVTVTTPDGTRTAYTYWADGTRATSTTVNGKDDSGKTVSLFHYTADGTLINDAHTRGGETATASYLMAGTRQARAMTGKGADQAAAAGAGYLIHDRHGNITVLAGQSGSVKQAYSYTDYGQPASHTGQPLTSPAVQHAGAARNPFTYAGEYTDPSGTQYLKARTYQPATGTFTTPDFAPRFNRYQAFGANPITSIDPQGTTEMPDWASYLIYGITLAVGVITTAISLGSLAAPLAVGITLAGLALDVASASLDIAALATGATQLEDPLNIASLALGGAGILLGIGGAVLGKLNKTAGVLTETADATAKPAPEAGADRMRRIFGEKIRDFGDGRGQEILNLLGNHVPERLLQKVAEHMNEPRKRYAEYSGIYVGAAKSTGMVRGRLANGIPAQRAGEAFYDRKYRALVLPSAADTLELPDWRPQGLPGVILHEFGHAVDHATKWKAGKAIFDRRGRIGDFLAEARHSSPFDKAHAGYVSNRKEFFADMFAWHLMDPSGGSFMGGQMTRPAGLSDMMNEILHAAW
ncbi:RHS repeat-associated core domain-containing protein [Streptomyces sp. NPDC001774]